MNATASIPQAVGDWSLRGVDADQVFASQQLSDTALTAAVRVTAKFDPSFPGWQLYRRVVAGTDMFNRDLEDWAVSTAWMLATAHKVKGREYVKASSRRPDWVAQAGLDALDNVLYGKYVVGLGDRADAFRVSPKTYQKIRDPMTDCMRFGLEFFASELRGEYFRSRKREMLDGNGTTGFPDARVKVDGDIKTHRQLTITGSATTKDAETRFSVPGWRDPESLHTGLSPDQLWHPERP